MNTSLTLLDEDDQKAKTGKTFSSVELITVACHAVVNVQFTAPDPKPDWFDDLEAKLDAAKAVGNEWIADLSVEVTKSIPLSVIDFGTTYTATTKQILAIAKAHPDATGKDDQYVQEIAGLITEVLLPQLGKTLADMDATVAKLKAWGGKLQTAHDDLTQGATNIQNTLTDLETDVTKMNSAITSLNDLIDSENRSIAIAAAATGVGIFAMVAGIALAFVTLGAGLVVAGVGAAAVIGGAVTWGVMKSRINAQFDEIAADQKELAQDQRQIIALQGLAVGSGTAVSSLESSSNALSSLRTSWGVFHGEIQAVVTKLQSGETALSTLVQGVFASSALGEWKVAIEFAQKLVEVAADPMQSDTQVLPMSSAA